MAPKQDLEERLRIVNDLSIKLIRFLPTSTDPPAIATLAADITKRIPLIAKLSPKRGVIPAKDIDGIDKVATELWNICNRLLRRGLELTPERGCPQNRLSVRAITFAFRLLCFTRWKAARQDGGGVEQKLGVVKLSLSAARTCLNQLDYDGALDVLKETIELTEQLIKLELNNEQSLLLRKYEADYFILRTSLCAKQDRLDVANYMFEKGLPTFKNLDPAYAEHLAEIVFDIGKTLTRKKDYKLGVVWLQRSYDLITMHPLDRLSRVGVEQRLAIIHAFVQGHILLGTTDGRKMAQEWVFTLENEIGDSPVTLMLKIKLLKSVEPEVFDVDAFADTLARFSRLENMSEGQFKTILHESKTLHQRRPMKALKILHSMLNEVVLDSSKSDWVSKTLVLLVFYFTTVEEVSSEPSLLEVIQGVHDVLCEPVDAQTAGAIQSILWKKIDGSITKGHVSDAESWCQVALHPLFEHAGAVNYGKIARKLIICALEKQDYATATDIYHGLAENIQREQTTAFLMFKVATRSHDAELAASCLAKISRTTKEGRNILYACVLDAQNSGNHESAISAMTVLMNINQTLPESEVHVPSVMRCIIRLLYRKLATADEDSLLGIASDICTVFEGAVYSISKSPSDSKGFKLFPIEELDWFSQNSYDTGIKNIEIWDPHFTGRILQSCLQILDFYPDDIPLEDAHDLSLKKLCCHFVVATSLAAIARCKNDVKEKLQAYLTLRKHVAKFDEEFQLRKDVFDSVIVEPDLRHKLAVLYVFDFEAACAHRDWGDLNVLVAKTVDFCEEMRLDMLKGMGDYVLSLVDMPTGDMYRVLKLIVNEIWKLEAFELDKLSRYLRCIFQAVLSSADNLALEVLGIFIGIKDATLKDLAVPLEEVEWMASTAFNHGIDFSCAGNDANSRTWCEKALELAQYQPDDGVFKSHLQERYAKLNLLER